MAVDSHKTGGAQFLGRSAAEQDAAFAEAARHSRRVTLLRKGLPIAAAAVLGLYFISAAVLRMSFGPISASVDAVTVSDGKLRMVNPKLEGFDRARGGYVIRADYADQDVTDPSQIELTALRAEMRQNDDDWSLMLAARGEFDTKKEQLEMLDGIDISTSSGLVGRMERATLDMKTQTLESKRPVRFEMINGTVDAKGLRYEANEKLIVFQGGVNVNLKKRPGEAPGKARSKEQAAEPQAEPAAAVQNEPAVQP